MEVWRLNSVLNFNSLIFGVRCVKVNSAVVWEGCDDAAAYKGAPVVGVFEGADGLENCVLFVCWGGGVDDGGVGLVDVVGDMGVCCSIFLLDACLE